MLEGLERVFQTTRRQCEQHTVGGARMLCVVLQGHDSSAMALRCQDMVGADTIVVVGRRSLF